MIHIEDVWVATVYSLATHNAKCTPFTQQAAAPEYNQNVITSFEKS